MNGKRKKSVFLSASNMDQKGKKGNDSMFKRKKKKLN